MKTFLCDEGVIPRLSPNLIIHSNRHLFFRSNFHRPENGLPQIFSRKIWDYKDVLLAISQSRQVLAQLFVLTG